MTSQTQRESDYWTHKKLDHDWVMAILPRSTRSLNTLPWPYQTYSHETHIKQSHFHNAKIHVQEFHAFFLLLQSCSPWWILSFCQSHPAEIAWSWIRTVWNRWLKSPLDPYKSASPRLLMFVWESTMLVIVKHAFFDIFHLLSPWYTYFLRLGLSTGSHFLLVDKSL